MRLMLLTVLVLLSVSTPAALRAEGAVQTPLAKVDVSLVDGEAIGFATFQSHNQKIVNNRHGLFLAYLRAANDDYTAQTWRLVRSTDGGKTFSKLHEATHPTNPPVLETDAAGNLFLIRPDFKEGDAYLYRFTNERGWSNPAVSKIPRGSAGKFCMMLDEPRKQMYYFAHNNTFHVVDLKGEIRSTYDLIKPGPNGYLQYPHLTLDSNGTLYAAWTSLKGDKSRPNGYVYWDIHAIRSTDGAKTWQTLGGKPLDLPVVADETGPADRITRDDEFDVNSWLSGLMVKDGKLHFAYWTRNDPERQRYVRYDLATAKRDVDIEPMCPEGPVKRRNDNGAFAARRSVQDSTLYFVTAIEDRRRLACLASDDNGKTWYRYAIDDKRCSNRVYSIGTGREITADGQVVGTFTDALESAETYYEPNSGRVYVFRIPAGISRANVAAVRSEGGSLSVDFDEPRGQPKEVRFSVDSRKWSAWLPYADSVTFDAAETPAHFQLKSRLDVVSPAYALRADAEPAPVHQVLAEKPKTMMLDYFTRLAADKPPRRPLPSTRKAWEKRRTELRRQLWDSLGNFPREDRPPLNARITGTIDHGDHVVQKVLYESLPGIYVTALVYVPKKIEGRVPAVLCVNGHWAESKATPLIQQRCMGLARMGVIAFCQDVIGTGERQAYDGSPPQTYHGFYRGAAPRMVDRSLLGYVIYECTRALDYLLTREDVDPRRIMCTGASGGGKQSMFFPALDDRLAGGVPVCYVSSYQAHMGATACVGEIPTGILNYSNQWEILALHAPRPLLCIAASRDVPVFLPREVYSTLEQTKRIYRLYGAADRVQAAEFDSKHDYNQPMRELLYRHVAEHLLGQPNRQFKEPDDLPVEKEAALRVGLPERSETMQSLTYRRAKELAARHRTPNTSDDWTHRRKDMLDRLKHDVLGGFPDPAQCKQNLIRRLTHLGHRVEQWTLEPESDVIVPALLFLPGDEDSVAKRPAVVVIDEEGKQRALERGLIDRLLAAGRVVLSIDYRGTGETAGTVPPILYGPGTPEYNLSNYGLFLGRPITGMRVFDVRCTVDFLASRTEVDAKQIALAGRGRGALVALLAAACDDRIESVALEELLATWVFNDEFVKIGLAYMMPRILTIGDMEHLAACAAPKRMLVLNPVDGRRRPLADGKQFGFTETVYGIHETGERFQRRWSEPDDAPAVLVTWLGAGETQ